ncbi:nicotinamide riboside transporter PnuC [uncultured Sunxiuqinia sp.]|uniref:nicotinamide riboside transporter PnuC n=1 Tax=uncultured Sunxiuqinia sp. TaxID=1573825 RepID=UPI002621ACF2|nr:nicotinamide riboside transporter PnuC [uncultured Sunxiuqinia sp.]
MIDPFLTWLSANYVELLGAVLGFAYIFLSIRQHIFTWPVGLLTSALYVYVFLVSKFYADMLLQVYYVGVSIYGWYFWLKGNPNSENELRVSRMPLNFYFPVILVSVLLFLLFLFGLKYYTDSPVPFGDSLTTALSIVATWMLARKYVEHWLIWIFVDFFSAFLYGFKGLWPTVILFLVYTGMAVYGYRSWRNDLIKQDA